MAWGEGLTSYPTGRPARDKHLTIEDVLLAAEGAATVELKPRRHVSSVSLARGHELIRDQYRQWRANLRVNTGLRGLVRPPTFPRSS